MNDIQGYQNGPIETGASRAKEMSPRAYNLAMSALIFLGFCAANLFFTGGLQDLVAYWFWTCLPDLAFTAANLWLTGYALRLSQGVFQSVFLGGAPRGHLHAASRRLLVRSGITLLISGLIGILFSGLRLLLSFLG